MGRNESLWTRNGVFIVLHHKTEYSTNAVMMDVPTKQWKQKSVGCMGQRVMERNVAIKVVPIGQEEGEFASDMVQKVRSRFVVMRDVPTKLSATMLVCGMEQSERRGVLAAMKDVITKQCKDEYV